MAYLNKASTIAIPISYPATYTLPKVEITPSYGGRGPAVLTTALFAGDMYRRYNENINRLNEQAHFSDRNANRLIRNIGLSTTRTSVPTHFPSGHAGSPSNPMQLGEVVVTAPFSNAYNSVLGISKRELEINNAIDLAYREEDESTTPSNRAPSNPEPNNKKPGRLKRLATWVRKHPWKTAGIVGVTGTVGIPTLMPLLSLGVKAGYEGAKKVPDLYESGFNKAKSVWVDTVYVDSNPVEKPQDTQVTKDTSVTKDSTDYIINNSNNNLPSFELRANRR